MNTSRIILRENSYQVHLGYLNPYTSLFLRQYIGGPLPPLPFSHWNFPGWGQTPFFFIIKVWENSPIMLQLMMVKDQSKVIVRHLHYRMRYLLLVIYTLEVTWPVNRNKVTGPVTIFGADAPPRLCYTERLGAIRQTIRRTLNWFLVFCRIFIPLTFWVIG